MVEDVYDQNIPTVAFWSLATSPRPRRHPAWQADVAQDSARSNLAFYMGLAQQFGLFTVYFFYEFCLATWAWSNNLAFLFSRHSLLRSISFLFSRVFCGPVF